MGVYLRTFSNGGPGEIRLISSLFGPSRGMPASSGINPLLFSMSTSVMQSVGYSCDLSETQIPFQGMTLNCPMREWAHQSTC